MVNFKTVERKEELEDHDHQRSGRTRYLEKEEVYLHIIGEAKT